MLIGTYWGVLSPKRRVAIPSKFRLELGQRIIIAKWYEGCLVLVSETNWQALLKRLTAGEKIITGPVRDTDRFILSSAYELVPDSQGRVVIPDSLVTYAELRKDIAFAGLGDRAEVWDQEKWKQREDYIAKHAAKFVEKLAQKKDD